MDEARWVRRPDGSNWGAFGPDDQRGRLNLVTREKVLQGIAEAREGLVFCLSLPLDYPGGNYHDLQRQPPHLEPVVRNGRIKYNLQSQPQHTDVYCDDRVTLHTHYSTHWDALAHVGAMFDGDGDGKAEIRYYNGYRGHTDIGGDPPAARALGIENMAQAGVQGRAVMVDLLTAYGSARRAVGYDELMRACDADGAVVEPGDMLCLHTGQAAALLAMGRKPDRTTLEDSFCHLDGADPRLLRWIDDSGIAALAADNFAVEAVPPRTASCGSAYEPLHELCLFKLGLHLGELWYLTELNDWLRAHRRTRFLLTAPPLRLPGAVGAPATPIGTV
jgi:kynurenine formamidase